jgi:hypothetical protein
MANIGALSICSLLLSALALPNALAAEYTLMPSPQTVHVGHFSAALKPVLTINSGEPQTPTWWEEVSRPLGHPM